MIGWVRPQILIPVHGEALHMAEHGRHWRVAPAVGKVVLCRNGDLVRLAPGDPAIIDEVPSGRLYKDGCLLVDAPRRARSRTAAGSASSASYSVALAMTERGEMVGDLELELTGIPETDARRQPDRAARL